MSVLYKCIMCIYKFSHVKIIHLKFSVEEAKFGRKQSFVNTPYFQGISWLTSTYLSIQYLNSFTQNYFTTVN